MIKLFSFEREPAEKHWSLRQVFWFKAKQDEQSCQSKYIWVKIPLSAERTIDTGFLNIPFEASWMTFFNKEVLFLQLCWHFDIEVGELHFNYWWEYLSCSRWIKLLSCLLSLKRHKHRLHWLWWSWRKCKLWLPSLMKKYNWDDVVVWNCTSLILLTFSFDYQ